MRSWPKEGQSPIGFPIRPQKRRQKLEIKNRARRISPRAVLYCIEGQSRGWKAVLLTRSCQVKTPFSSVMKLWGVFSLGRATEPGLR